MKCFEMPSSWHIPTSTHNQSDCWVLNLLQTIKQILREIIEYRVAIVQIGKNKRKNQKCTGDIIKTFSHTTDPMKLIVRRSAHLLDMQFQSKMRVENHPQISNGVRWHDLLITNGKWKRKELLRRMRRQNQRTLFLFSFSFNLFSNIHGVYL